MSTSSLPSFIKIHQAVLERKSKMWKVYAGRTTTTDGRTDDGRCAMTIAHSSLRLRWAKTAYFTQNWHFFIQVDILISCPSFSRVLHNSTQTHRKIRYFSRGIWLIIHDLHFLTLTCLHKNHSFSLALLSEAIAIDELGSISPKL